MKLKNWMTAAALGVALGAAAPVAAQGNSRHETADRDRNEEHDRDDDDHRYGDRQGAGKSSSDAIYGRVSDRRDDDDDRDDDDRYDGDDRNERGNGPSFCRSGAGHPRFGWNWCRERGWDRSSNTAVRWERRTWEDVIFRTPRTDRRQTLDRRGLGEVLGDVVFGRIDTRRSQLGAATNYVGRWITSGSSRELWITAGGVPIARFVDLNGDRRVDSIYMAER